MAAVAETRDADGTVLREAEEALHRAVTANRVQWRMPGRGGAVDWSPSGDTVAAEGPAWSGNVELRNVATGASTAIVHGSGGDVTDVAFSADGALVATTGSDGVARLWDAATGREVRSVAGSGWAYGPAFSPDGRRFAAAWPEDGTGVVRVVDVATGELVGEAVVPGATATAFDPQGARLAVTSPIHPDVLVVDVGSGAAQPVLTGHRAGINDVAWSPDGAMLATASLDGGARVADAATGQHLFALLGHGGGVAALDWSSRSDRLLTASEDGTAKVWGVLEGDGREMATLSAHDTRGGLSSVAFSPDGSRAITGDRGMTSAIVWDVSPLAGAEVANLPAVLFHGGAAEFASDGGRLLASAGHGAVGIWDPTTWSMIETFGSGGPRPAAPLDSGQWIRSDEDVERMAVDPDADLVAVVRAAGDGRVEVWDVERGQQLFVVETDDQVPRVAWSPDGELLAVTDGARRRVLVVDRDGQEVASGDFPDAVWIGFVEFSPDGDGLLVTLEPDQVVLWNWRTRTVEHRIDTSAHMAVMSPSGDLVAVKPRWDTDLRNVEVWDPRLAQLVATLEGQSGEVNDVAFSPDGQLAATVSGDGSLRLWEARTGVPVLVLPGHPATATTVSFSPDGRWLASSGAEGVVRVWALDLDELLQVAERSLTRPLTDEECRQFLHTPSCG